MKNLYFSEKIELKEAEAEEEEIEENASAVVYEETENLSGLIAEDTATKTETIDSKHQFMNVLL